jgi:hypothetical protein
MTVVHNIPVRLAPHYAGQDVIVRTSDPLLLTESLREPDLEHLVSIQLLSLKTKVEPLATWGYAVPVELIMREPEEEYPWLYRHAKLLDKHPVRVLIPAVGNFSRAVKVSTSLQFSVKLEVGQISSDVASELLNVLDFYLHHPVLSQPVEFFHSALEGFYHQQPVELWDIQEENPSYVRYVTDDGAITLTREGPRVDAASNLGTFVSDLKTEILAARGECSSCEFFEHCGSYFKWPDKHYDCVHVKVVFASLKDAARELGRDIEKFVQANAEARR